MSSLIVQVDHGSDPTLVLVEGELDIASAPSLRTELGRIVHEGRGDVLVDLSDTTFIDSTGLAVLLNAVRRLTRARRRLQVRCGPGPARDVIERARLGMTLGLTE